MYKMSSFKAVGAISVAKYLYRRVHLFLFLSSSHLNNFIFKLNYRLFREKKEFDNFVSPEDLKRKGVCYILWDFPALSEKFILAEVEWVVNQRIPVRVFYFRTPQNSEKLDFIVESKKVKNWRQIKDLIIEEPPAIIHSHFVTPTVKYLTRPLANFCKIPYTFIPNAVDIFLKSNAISNQLFRSSVNKYCMAVISIGSFHTYFYLNHGLPKDRIHVNLMGIKLENFPFLTKPDNLYSEKVLRIFCISRFCDKKGLDLLITAVKQLPANDVFLSLYGYGEEEVKLRELADGCSNIVFEGVLSGSKELQSAHIKNHLFILPCRQSKTGDMDGMPVCLMESMAMGTPVITTPVASIPDLIKDGFNGFLCEPESPESIVLSIYRYLNLPASERIRLIKNARQGIVEKHDVKIIGKGLLKIWTNGLWE